MTRPNECAYCGYDFEDCKCKRQEQMEQKTYQLISELEYAIKNVLKDKISDDELDDIVLVATNSVEMIFSRKG